MATIRPQAAVGIRFHQAACVYPCEFSTSFMPETTRATTGVGFAAAGTRTADHSSACNCAVRALTCWSLLLVAGRVEHDALVQVIPQQRAHLRRIRGGQQVGPHVFGADRVGLRLLEVLALVVPARWPSRS